MSVITEVGKEKWKNLKADLKILNIKKRLVIFMKNCVGGSATVLLSPRFLIPFGCLKYCPPQSCKIIKSQKCHRNLSFNFTLYKYFARQNKYLQSWTNTLQKNQHLQQLASNTCKKAEQILCKIIKICSNWHQILAKKLIKYFARESKSAAAAIGFLCNQVNCKLWNQSQGFEIAELQRQMEKN